MRRPGHRSARSIAVAGLFALFLVGLTPTATAQEATTTTVAVEAQAGAGPLVETAPLEGATWDLPFESLGYAPTLSPELYTGAIELDVPAIAGLEAVRLQGVVAAARVESGALVTVYADELPIAEATIASGRAEAIDLELPPDSTTVTIESSPLVEGLTECPVGTAAIELREPSLVYQGEPSSPQNPDDFLPVALHGVTIAMDERTPVIDQGAIDLVTALARRYPDRFAVEIAAVGAGDLPPAVRDPFRRTFWLVPDGPTDLEIMDADGFGVLRSSPDGVRDLVGDPPAPIGIDESGKMALTPHLARSDVDEGAGHAELSIVAGQASLGGPHQNLTVRAGGRVTHLAGGQPSDATVGLWVGERLLTSAIVDEVGRFDVEYEVDDELLTRDTVFLLTADAPRVSDDYCDGGPPLRLELDEGSWVGGRVGQPIAAGFERYPQVLLSDFTLFVGGSLDDLEAAAGLLALLQNISPNPLSPETRGAAGSVTGPALVVGGPSDGLDGLGPATPPWSSFSRGSTRASAVLVAVEHTGHDVLLLRSTERGAQTRLVDQIRDAGFAELRGTAVALIGDELVVGRRDPASGRALLPTLSEEPDPGAESSSTAQLFLYGLLGAAAVMGLALALGPIRQLLKR